MLLGVGQPPKESFQKAVVIVAFPQVRASVMGEAEFVVDKVKLVRADANNRSCSWQSTIVNNTSSTHSQLDCRLTVSLVQSLQVFEPVILDKDVVRFV